MKCSCDECGRSGGYALYCLRCAEMFIKQSERKWVGLTNEERNKLWRDVVGWGDPSHDDEDLMVALEAKLKEKNT